MAKRSMVEAADLICHRTRSLHSVVAVVVVVVLEVVAVALGVTEVDVVAEVALVAEEEVAVALVDPLRQWLMRTRVTSSHSKARKPLSDYSANQNEDTNMSH